MISDIWGKEKSDWLINYTRILETKYDITWYDSCELGNIDTSKYTQEHLHQQFVSTGIEKAVEKLAQLEPNPVCIIGFSVGGVIAWKYGLRNNQPNSLVCISSTRLRYETQRPKGTIELYFGEQDTFSPSTSWLNTMSANYKIIPQENHEIYRHPEFAKKLSTKIIENSTLGELKSILS